MAQFEAATLAGLVKAPSAYDPAGANRLGPSLHGVVGRQSGGVPGFNYSPANRNAGITWTPEKLFALFPNLAEMPDRVFDRCLEIIRGTAIPIVDITAKLLSNALSNH